MRNTFSWFVQVLYLKKKITYQGKIGACSAAEKRGKETASKPSFSLDTISPKKSRLTWEKEGVTKHLLLPGVDTMEEKALQIHQDVVTYIQK